MKEKKNGTVQFIQFVRFSGEQWRKKSWTECDEGQD